ncbi:hypothetical protein AB0K29_28010, partial [Micromonospora humida]
GGSPTGGRPDDGGAAHAVDGTGTAAVASDGGGTDGPVDGGAGDPDAGARPAGRSAPRVPVARTAAPGVSAATGPTGGGTG